MILVSVIMCRILHNKTDL